MVFDEAKARAYAFEPAPRPTPPGPVYLLCIPESDFISGQVVMCAGGLIL